MVRLVDLTRILCHLLASYIFRDGSPHFVFSVSRHVQSVSFGLHKIAGGTADAKPKRQIWQSLLATLAKPTDFVSLICATADFPIRRFVGRNLRHDDRWTATRNDQKTAIWDQPNHHQASQHSRGNRTKTIRKPKRFDFQLSGHRAMNATMPQKEFGYVADILSR